MADDKGTAQPSNPEPAKKADPPVPEGVQKRIDELVAKNGELARQFQEQSARWEAEKAEYEARLPPPVATPPPTMEQQIFQRLDQMEQMVQRMGQGLGYQQQRQGLDFYGQQERVPPEVLKLAQKIADDEFRTKGVIVDREVAITHAFGLLGREDHKKRVAAQQPTQPTGPLLFGTNDQAPVLNRTQTFQYPPDFKKWPLNKQAAWLKANYPDEALRRTSN